jgi:hypothetical protein
VRDEFHSANLGNNRSPATRLAPARRRAAGNSTVATLFMYDGKFYVVPKDYEFPKIADNWGSSATLFEWANCI